ncbi:MAG: YncE family protein, partial [Marmoricola sp.]
MKLRSLLVVLALGAASLVAGTQSAEATALTKLPFGYLTDIQVDDAHSTVFLSGDGSLVTTDLDGHLTSSPNPGDVGRIAMTPDGNALVITRPASRGISVLDPATRTITKTITLPAGCSVGDIAPASGKVFFYSFCTGDDSWKISAVDLTTSLITFGVQPVEPGYNGELYSVPGAPSMLVARSDDVGVTIYDTNGGAIPTATVRASRAIAPYDLALTPDGSQVVTTGMTVYSTTDLAQVGAYYAPDSGPLAIRADGIVAGAGSAITYFKPGVFEPDQVHQASSGSGPYSQPGSLAFGAKRVYRVTDTVPAYLSVDTPGPPAALTINPVASTYGYGASPSVKVTIVSPTTNRTLDLYATPAYGGSKKLVKTVNVGSGGSLTTAMPAAYINTTYTAEFTGDGDFSASSAATSVKVRPQITLTTSSTSKS